jgi:AcrR family transcriptional regulator
MSAYRHFTSKDDLVAAALELYNPRHVRWLTGGGSPGAAGAADVASPAHMSGVASEPGVAGPTGVGAAGAAAGASDSGSVAGLGGPGGIGEDADADPAEAAGRILSAFDRLESAAGGENFRGCPFVDAALAASGPDQRIAAIAGRHKQDLVQELAGLAARAGMREPEEVGAAVALVIDGAAAQAAVAPDPAARRLVVRRGRRIAETLLATGGQP